MEVPKGTGGGEEQEEEGTSSEVDRGVDLTPCTLCQRYPS